MHPVPSSGDLFAAIKCCVIVPTYNNRNTIRKVLDGVKQVTTHIIVVNDGSTDETRTILESYPGITVVHHTTNQGKGMAIRNGFREAIRLGYENAITIDSDGQHFPSDLTKFLEAATHHPNSIIVGARNMRSENVPGKSSFGNTFSNFWFRFVTGIRLPDTQSGFRFYPIKKLSRINFFTRRFEFEIEVLVRSAWRNVPVFCIPVSVHYDAPGQRVSHFRPFRDFARISLLNTWLVFLAVIWYKPMKFFRGLTPTNIGQFLKKQFFDRDEPISRKTFSVMVGLFFGVIPIWGYQLVSAIAVAYLLKLNKAIVILTANISIPPLLPFILFGSLKTGELILDVETRLTLSEISLDSVKLNIGTYLAGACILAVALSVAGGAITFVILSLLRVRS